MASHGRGFWSRDNVGPLREYRPGMLDGDVVMFEPAPAYRLANRAVSSWWAGEGVESAEGLLLTWIERSYNEGHQWVWQLVGVAIWFAPAHVQANCPLATVYMNSST